MISNNRLIWQLKKLNSNQNKNENKRTKEIYGFSSVPTYVGNLFFFFFFFLIGQSNTEYFVIGGGNKLNHHTSNFSLQKKAIIVN